MIPDAIKGISKMNTILSIEDERPLLVIATTHHISDFERRHVWISDSVAIELSVIAVKTIRIFPARHSVDVVGDGIQA